MLREHSPVSIGYPRELLPENIRKIASFLPLFRGASKLLTHSL